jgi:hypothetical protein
MKPFLATATKNEIITAKSLLSQYLRMKAIIEDYERNPTQTDKQAETFENAILCTNNIERAVNQIVDPNVKALIEYRFLKGNRRAATILKFSGWDYCDKTIDRKINEGIAAVANSLLLL